VHVECRRQVQKNQSGEIAAVDKQNVRQDAQHGGLGGMTWKEARLQVAEVGRQASSWLTTRCSNSLDSTDRLEMGTEATVSGIIASSGFFRTGVTDTTLKETGNQPDAKERLNNDVMAQSDLKSGRKSG